MSELPQPLDELLSTALEHGVQWVAHGGPLLPFGIVDHGDGLELHRFHAGDGDLVESQAAGRTWLSQQQGLRRACIAWDGYPTLDGERTDAIYAEACDDSGDDSWIAAQRYARIGDRELWAASAEPVLCGRATALF